MRHPLPGLALLTDRRHRPRRTGDRHPLGWRARFAVFAGLGTHAHSASLWSRVKGKAKDALRGLGSKHPLIAWPSLPRGNQAELGQPARASERWGGPVTDWLGPLLPAAKRCRR